MISNQPYQVPMYSQMYPQPQYQFSQPLQQMQNTQQPVQQIQQQIQNGGFIPVPSEEVARNYPVAPGVSITFKNENAPYVYTKTMGFSQLDRPEFEKYRLVKEEVAQQYEQNTDNNEELRTEIEQLKTEIEELKSKIQEIKNKPQVPQNRTPKTVKEDK